MAKTKMPASERVGKGLAEHGKDLLQEMVAVFAQVLMSADVDVRLLLVFALGQKNKGKGRGCERPCTLLLQSTTYGDSRLLASNPLCRDSATVV